MIISSGSVCGRRGRRRRRPEVSVTSPGNLPPPPTKSYLEIIFTFPGITTSAKTSPVPPPQAIVVVIIIAIARPSTTPQKLTTSVPQGTCHTPCCLVWHAEAMMMMVSG